MSTFALPTVQLNEHGRPLLLPSEVEIVHQDQVDICVGESKTSPYMLGLLCLTSHRILWIGGKSGVHITLYSIKRIDVAGGWLRSSKIVLEVDFHAEHIRLKFQAGNRDVFRSKMEEAIRRQAWKDAIAAPPAPIATTKRVATSAGVGHIMGEIDRKQRETDAALTDAFSDLTALMNKAKDMVKLADRLKSSMNKDNTNEQEMAELNAVLIDIGIASPVTRESAGSVYYQQLSRQLAEFMKPHLLKHGGVLSLIDVYCLFNRARGTELVSPDDVVKAVEMFPQLGLLMSCRRFASGVTVVQLDSNDDNQVAARILEFLNEHGSVDATEVASFANIPVALAKEQLLGAESKGLLCRDETIEGLRFYDNFFLKYSCALSS